VIAAAPGARRDLGLAAWQVRYEQRAFWRNRSRAFFVILMPIMFLVIFGTIYEGKTTGGRGGGIPYNDYFVPGILAYAVITTTFVNIAISTAILRDTGVLKRMQGMPLPRWAYIAGRIGSAALTMLAMTVLTLLIARVAYGVHVRAATLPGLLLALALGSACFTSLGIGIVRFISSAEAAPAVVNFAILPLTFISGVWFVTDGLAAWLRDLASIFPVHALAHALQHAFNPYTSGAGIDAGDMRTLAVWLVAGTVLMVVFLREPLGDR
jgi:ABC-2 type transport system permease protein